MATVTTPQDAACPSPEALGGLLRTDTPNERQRALTDHVGHCAGCQDRMESLATEGGEVNAAAVRGLDRPPLPPSDSAYWRALKEAEDTATHSFDDPDNDEPLAPADLALDFLTKSETPDVLGRLAHFDVKRIIGRGGMGVVLQGFDTRLHRDVAIKVLDPQLANNATARQRFCREARAAAAVSHDNLVAVFQVNEEDMKGLPYLVMQLVVGESLEQRLRRVGKLSVKETVRVGMQAAAGLAAAHATGLIHRDIKPGNILLEAGSDKAKLTDFGLARAAEDLKLTRTGFVAGTPLYMAPEQARGDDIDARADLFSLGSVLYEALAGKPPFEGRTPLAVLRRVADEAHPNLRKLNPEVPGWLEEAVDKLLAKDPADRYQTAKEVAELLAFRLSTLHSLSPLEVPAQVNPCAAALVVESQEKAARAKVCYRTAGALASVFATGTLAGAVGMMLFLPPRVERVEVPATPVAPTALVGPAAVNPTEVGPKPVRTLSSRAGAVLSVALSPDGKLLATGGENGSVTLWDIEGKEPRTLLEFRDPKGANARAHSGPVWALDFSADGTNVVSVSDDGAVKVWDARKGTQVKNLQTGGSVRSAAISPNGVFVAIGDRQGGVQVFDLGGDRQVTKFEQGSTVNAVAFSPDSLMLATGSVDGKVAVHTLAGDAGLTRLSFAAHQAPIYGLSFSPDGERLVTAGWDRTAVVWNVANGQRVLGVQQPDTLWNAQFAPCGQVFATAGQDGRTVIWDAVTGEQLREFGYHKGSVHALHFGKARQLVTGGRDGMVNIWDGQCEAGAGH